MTMRLIQAERNDPSREPQAGKGLLGGFEHNVGFGQQLSSFTELRQGKKPKELFRIGHSPLKVDRSTPATD
jgi:hypothetical protein